MFSAHRYSQIRRTYTPAASAALIFVQLHCQLAVVMADPTGSQCSQPAGRSDTCVCETSDGVIDLTGLANDDGESARYITIMYFGTYYHPAI